MAVITISREYFALRSPTAKEIADELGYRLVTKDTLEKVLRQYGHVQLQELYDAPNFWASVESENIELISLLNQTIQGFAKQDNVLILGRGGYLVLQDYANVLNIRVKAPFDVRVQRVMEQESLGKGEAEELVKQNDQARTKFVKDFYEQDFHNTRSFRLMLDTGVISSETAVEWILKAARSLDAQSFENAKTTQSIELDPVLERTIQQVLAFS